MINTSIFVITIVTVLLLALIIAWLMQRNHKSARRMLEAGNNQLREQLHTAEGKAQMLIDENVNLKTQNAAAGEKVSLLQQRAIELNEKVEKLNGELKDLDDLKDRLDREKAALETKLESVTRTREQLEQESRQAFKLVAGELLDHSRKTMNEEGKLSLGQLLDPLREQIVGLNKELKDYQHKQDVNSELFNKEIEKLRTANKEISQEATRLSNALVSNNKIQGDWGEGVLKRILDHSGLVEGVNYEQQVTRDDDGKVIKNEEGGMLRPDFILFMPDGKKLVIDSKVSLTAFVEYVNATTPEEQQAHLKNHIASVKAQVDLLAKKGYTSHVKNSAEFALMFVPNEPAYLAAMQGNQQLWEYAYNKHVVIVSPTHLLSVAQLLTQLWSRDKQNKNAVEIAKEVMRLLKKLDDFTADLNKIQNGINSMQSSFDSAMTRFSGKGGILSKGDTIKKLSGLKPEEIEE